MSSSSANTSTNSTSKTASAELSRPTSALSNTSSSSGQKEDKSAIRKSVLNMAKNETVTNCAPVDSTNKSANIEHSRPTSALSNTSSSSGQKEDKSALRKSTINMAKDVAIKARALEEEKSKQNARRLGIVNALSAKFNLAEAQPNAYTYKRSRLLAKKDEERPKRTYGPIIKPVINDNFDKQIEEIRMKMRTGNKILSSQFTELKQGIATVADDARRAILEQKHQQLLIEADATFGKIGDNFKKWKENRTAEQQKELIRREQEMHHAKATNVEIAKTTTMAQPLVEPKKTVRQLKSSQETKMTNVMPSFVTECETINSGKNSSSKIKMEIQAKKNIEAIKENNHKNATTATEVSMKLQSPTMDNYLTKLPNVENSSTTSVENSKKQGIKPDPVIPKTRKILGSTENREIRKYGTRNKTQELMNFAKDAEMNDEIEESKIHRQNCIHRRNRYIRKPFDIDILLGYDKENSFEQFEARFAASGCDKRSIIDTDKNDKKSKRRRKESKKIWISELRDIDKIYRTSELRDIINSVRI
ncbi:hypothetical protein LOAG_18690 [Loa loa]|uniref:Uncharacterized protein n=1 Tax=Loa loa TaxID=7209 RepID=A0A1S0UE24_LOALO|nr:hypothetical protein LOAG_18690 [Loa loa]EJD73922.1 hypothetical protein LOAG_18690 [Loa loa]